jgi:hypothetical protein
VESGTLDSACGRGGGFASSPVPFVGAAMAFEEYNIVSDSGVTPDVLGLVVGSIARALLPILGYIGGMVVGVAVMWRVIRTVAKGIGSTGGSSEAGDDKSWLVGVDTTEDAVYFTDNGGEVLQTLNRDTGDVDYNWKEYERGQYD